jgi:hypothetical protein
MPKFQPERFDKVPSGQEDVDVFVPKNKPPAEFQKRAEKPSAGPEAVGERKRRFGTFAKFLLYGSSIISAFQGYEYWQPKVDALRAEMGDDVKFTLASKENDSLRTDFRIQKEENGTYILSGLTSGGPDIVDPKRKGEIITHISKSFHCPLPASTDISALLDRLKTARHPGEIIHDLLESSKETTFMRLEERGHGTSVNYQLQFIPGGGREGSHAIETTTDEHGKKHVTHIAFVDAERRAESM